MPLKVDKKYATLLKISKVVQKCSWNWRLLSFSVGRSTQRSGNTNSCENSYHVGLWVCFALLISRVSLCGCRTLTVVLAGSTFEVILLPRASKYWYYRYELPCPVPPLLDFLRFPKTPLKTWSKPGIMDGCPPSTATIVVLEKLRLSPRYQVCYLFHTGGGGVIRYFPEKPAISVPLSQIHGSL